MLENLSERLQGIFSGLRSKGRLTEDDINAAMREIRQIGRASCRERVSAIV